MNLHPSLDFANDESYTPPVLEASMICCPKHLFKDVSSVLDQLPHPAQMPKCGGYGTPTAHPIEPGTYGHVLPKR